MQLPPVDRTPAQWRPQGADLYSTGASGAVPVRPVNAANAVESTDRLGEGASVREPTRPSAPDDENRDWTLPIEKKHHPKEAEAPPKDPPLHKLMLDFIQSMWRASASAVDVAQHIHQAAQQERQAQEVKDDQQSPTYADPKVKRTGGL
ncbi:MAG: hypothetical protein JSR53_05995 [Proteobacteria bacterium]|nr:hypothetical protein [Pseudomonadota bacterium]